MAKNNESEKIVNESLSVVNESSQHSDSDSGTIISKNQWKEERWPNENPDNDNNGNVILNVATTLSLKHILHANNLNCDSKQELIINKEDYDEATLYSNGNEKNDKEGVDDIQIMDNTIKNGQIENILQLKVADYNIVIDVTKNIDDKDKYIIESHKEGDGVIDDKQEILKYNGDGGDGINSILVIGWYSNIHLFFIYFYL